MKRIGTLCIVLGLVAALAGCGETKRMVNWYGSYNVDGEMQLSISTLGLSQIQFELKHIPSERVIVSDVGSSKKGWFFVWDKNERLWAHWDNTGTVVYLPGRDGQFRKYAVTRGHPLLDSMPPEFSDQLPKWAKRSLGI